MKRAWLIEKRKNLNITQEELAKKVEIATNTISQYENGVRTPRHGIAKKIANVLNCEWTLFYEDKAS